MAAALSVDPEGAGEGPGMVCPAEAKGYAPDVELCRRMGGKTVLQGRQSVFVGIHGLAAGFSQKSSTFRAIPPAILQGGSGEGRDAPFAIICCMDGDGGSGRQEGPERGRFSPNRD